ncbi:secreted protein [Colletotrichum musicola]|uniref:Secreted protein n=1 Tax=Colletotrichum musicola TaxID=2175873 RepID=A0A8H6IWJ3_9PEZI|nr:secreted protein [Colletotrichum musicola]
MRSSTVVLGLAASMASAAVVPIATIAPLPLGEIGWHGAPVAGGPEIDVWGDSFEDIEAKIKAEYNPDFSIYLQDEQEAPGTSDDPAVAARDQLERRARNRNCDKRFGEVVAYYAEQATNNLRRINGNSCKARARHCVRTQCVDGAAVGMCNDNHHDIDIACTTIADFAAEIQRGCYRTEPQCDAHGNCVVSPWRSYTVGQIFSDHLTWNVIVGHCTFFGSGTRPVKA